MTFDEVLARTVELLREQGRVTYPALKRRFDIDDDYLADLKTELIDALGIAEDRDGRLLVLITGAQSGVSGPAVAPSPAQYTPAHLAERIQAEHAAMAARGVREGERKTITALFADLKGSTALLEGLDPEQARALIDPALQLMMDAVHRYDGYVAQALGDGILALFGAPVAQEDHVQRALFAALHMQEALRNYANAARLRHGVALAMRIGINTGEVVVRSIRKDDLHTDYVPVGHSINLAARMEQMAAPGSILVTEHVQKLAEGYVALKALGTTQVKGVEAPLAVFEVVGPGQFRTRIERSVRHGLTRFVGRRQELEHLLRALTDARAGHGQVVGVMGEPGMGKSRLFHEFKALAQSTCTVFEAYSASHGKAAPYLPVIELLKSWFQIQTQDDERTRREKVIGRVLGLDRGLEDTLPYFFALLNVDDPAGTLTHMEAQARRRRTFEALKRVTLRESVDRPVLVVFEDLHWIDSETQGVLDSLVESLASARILLLTNYRPEYRHEWGNKTYYTQLRLAPLSPAEADEFLAALLGEVDGGPAEPRWRNLRGAILQRTEGTPFFMEEVVQELFEQGVLNRNAAGRVVVVPGARSDLDLPPTVQGVLAARIDRLPGDEKALLQELSVIGREFSYDLARAVVARSDDALRGLLAGLQRREFLYEQPSSSGMEFLFKHALTQEVAYQTLLLENRKRMHERTARVIEDIHASEIDDHYGALAHHYSRGGDAEKALEYLEKAGRQATRQSAANDAVNYFKRALELLAQVDPGGLRERDELRLMLGLLGSLRMIEGMGSEEVRRASFRVRELSERVGTSDDVFRALAALRNSYTMRGECRTALRYAEEMMAIAQREEDVVYALYAHVETAICLLYAGEIAAGLAGLERVRTLYDAERYRAEILTFGFDPQVVALIMGAQALWVTGYPVTASDRISESQALARAISDPFMIGVSMLWGAMLHVCGHEIEECRVIASAALEHAHEHGFPDWIAIAQILRGWASVHVDGAVWIDELVGGIATYRARHSELVLPLFLGLAGEAYLHIGRVAEARAAIDEGLVVARRNSEGLYEAELLRLSGEVALREPAAPDEGRGEAERCFLEALQVAERHGARAWELRACTSLVRLQAAHGGAAASRERLQRVYDGFTEGFETHDLVAARELLARVAASR